MTPNNKQIEDAVLGAVILSPESCYSVFPRLFEELFHSDANKAVLRALQSLFDTNATIDLLTVYEQINRNGDASKIEGAYYLTKLQNNVVSGQAIETHINFLSELYLKREVSKIGQSAYVEAINPENDAFEVANKAVGKIEAAQELILGGQVKDLTYYVKEMLTQHSQVTTTGAIGIKTGLEVIDNSISGLVAPDLIIVAARPGQGKTALALTITLNTSVRGNIPCAWFSLEMDGVQLVRRLTSMLSGIDHEKIRSGKTTEHELQRLNECANVISESKIYIEDRASVNIRDIKARAHVLKKKHGIQYIVVDYLQLMDGVDTKNKSRENIVSEISRGLKVLAKELSIPIIALSQLSRAVESRPDKKPQLSDLRESGGIEQDADEVIFIMRPEYYGFEEMTEVSGVDYSPKGLAIITTAKNRHGTTGDNAAHFNGSLMRFEDLTFSPF